MPSKRGTGTAEPTWRPLHKLSGLIVRRGSAKGTTTSAGTGKPAPEITEEKTSVFSSFKRQRKVSEEATVNFKPLEVESNALEGLHLPDGWLEPHTGGATSHAQERRLPAIENSSITPIADFFASKSVLDLPASLQEAPKASKQTQSSQNTKRPFSMLEPVYARAPVNAGQDSAESQSVTSVLERGRPVEARHPTVDTPNVTKIMLRRSLPPGMDTTTIENAISPKDVQPQKPPEYSFRKPATPEPQLLSQNRPVENRNSAAVKRHSMYEGVGAPAAPVAAPAKPTVPALRSSSAAPVDRVRIQAWQKHVTSAPNSIPSPVDTGAPAQAAFPVRKPSTRGGVSNRLAWIKELEEKKSGNVNKDLGALKKQGGSVSDKLAMFENKQTLTAPTARLPPLSRSNSTSRFSAAGLESVFSASSNTATASPRTSIDTVRSTHRTSSVMSHYDDSFCKKMESVVSGYAPETDQPTPPEKKRVSAQFVPVQPTTSESKPAQEETNDQPDVPEKEQAVAEVAPESTSAQKETEAQPSLPETEQVVAEVVPETTPAQIETEDQPKPSEKEEVVAEAKPEQPGDLETAPAQEKLDEQPKSSEKEEISVEVKPEQPTEVETAPAPEEAKNQPSAPEKELVSIEVVPAEPSEPEVAAAQEEKNDQASLPEKGQVTVDVVPVQPSALETTPAQEATSQEELKA